MTDIEKVINGLEHCSDRSCKCDECAYWNPHRTIDDEYCGAKVNRDALELLKGYKKLKEQLKELQIIENSRVKDCDDACDWEARDYHKGRFDAYSIALAHFDRKDGEQE